MPALRLFFTRESAPQVGLHSQHGEQAGGNTQARHALRLAIRRQVVALARRVKQRHLAEDVILPLPVMKVRRRGDAQIIGLGNLRAPYVHQTVRLRIGQRPQEHRIDQAEDDGVGSQAQRERSHRSHRKPGVAAQIAYAQDDIAPKAVHRGKAKLLVVLFPPQRHAAHLQPRQSPCLIWRHTSAHVLLGRQVQMTFKLPREFAVVPAPSEQRRAELGEQHKKPGLHDRATPVRPA